MTKANSASRETLDNVWRCFSFSKLVKMVGVGWRMRLLFDFGVAKILRVSSLGLNGPIMLLVPRKNNSDLADEPLCYFQIN